MINLNEVKDGGVSIFNGGNAGAARATLKSVNKKQPSDPDNAPDYKLVFEDKSGEVNRGIYVPTDETKAAGELSILMHIGRAVMGKDYKFPEVNSYEEAYKTVLSLVKKHGVGQEFNIFVCYGWSGKPSMYLGLRRYNFMESGEVALESSKLIPSNSDVMERIQPDNGGSSSSDTLESLGNDLLEDDDDDLFKS